MQVFDWLRQFLIDQAKENPVAVFVMLLAFVRLFGTVIETGWRGVLFRFGRVAKVLEPGFHYLIPLVHHVRKVRVRSVTINLARQRVTTRDGLVYDVDANIVYHVGDPAQAVVQVDDVTTGCQNVVPLVIAGIVAEQTSRTLTDREQMDREFHHRLQQELARWGLVIEHAGFQSIAPSTQTLRLTQLRLRIAERCRAWRRLREGGVPPAVGLMLLGSEQQLLGRATARYRRFQKRAYRSRRVRKTRWVPLDEWKVGDRVEVDYQKTGLYFSAIITDRAGSVVHVTYSDGEVETTTVAHLRKPSTRQESATPPPNARAGSTAASVSQPPQPRRATTRRQRRRLPKPKRAP